MLHTHMHEFRLNIDIVHGLAAVRLANTRERVGDRGQHYRHKLIYMYMRALEASGLDRELSEVLSHGSQSVD